MPVLDRLVWRRPNGQRRGALRKEIPVPNAQNRQRPLGADQKYLLSMVTPEWPGGAPTDGRSLRGLQSLEKRGLAQLVNNRWSVTTDGRTILTELQVSGEL
jgi:hypothetical protein